MKKLIWLLIPWISVTFAHPTNFIHPSLKPIADKGCLSDLESHLHSDQDGNILLLDLENCSIQDKYLLLQGPRGLILEGGS